ncbi:MAG: YggT family protein [Rhizomicrobium sp.]
MYAANPFIWLILEILDLYTWVIIAAVVASWLVTFRVINVYNSFARSVLGALEAMTEPVFRQVRRVVPIVGGLDLSPLIVLIAVMFLQRLVIWLSAGGLS